MSGKYDLDVVRLSSTIRFVRGYRYLDRCGEALLRLENSTDEGWIPGEIAPKGGHLRNYRLGLALHVHSEAMTVSQTEYISFEHFQDQTCRIYEVLWKTFEIDKILTPTFQVILQIGFEELARANAHALKLCLCKAKEPILQALGGHESAVGYTLCTEDEIARQGQPLVQRHRLDFQVLSQERQPEFDQRLMRRLALLPAGQHKAIGDLRRLRSQHPKIQPAAVQFDLENSWEGELLTRTFDIAAFLADSWEWVKGVQQTINVLQTENSKR